MTIHPGDIKPVTEWDWHWPNGEKVKRGKRYWYDLESNGLLDTIDTIHSLVLKDMDTGEIISCAGDRGADVPGYPSIEFGMGLLQKAEVAIGHNVLGYDRKAIKVVYKDYKPPFERDTLVLAKMVWPTDRLKELDFPRWRRGALPGKLIGTHGLEAWGYRMGRMKGEYSATVKEHSKTYAQNCAIMGPEAALELVPEDFHVLATTDKMGRPCLDPWLAWNKPMQDYCVQDVEVTAALYDLIMGHLLGTAKPAHGIPWSPRSVALEHLVWVHCLEEEERGIGFDKEEAIKEAAKLKNRQGELEAELRGHFGQWWQAQSDPVKGELPAISRSVKRPDLPNISRPRYGVSGKRLADYVGPPQESYSTDAPFVKIKRMEFNPKSRRHLGDRLQAVFGWQPTEWVGVKEEQAKVDETTIKEMETSILPQAVKDLILEYLVVSKFLGQLADGSKSWIDLCKEDGRIHGRVDPLGTITHRGAHKSPNKGQVPSVSFDEKKVDGKVVSKEIIWGFKGGFGAEARGLFRPGSKKMPRQTGTDASGLELRLLGHHLAPYDDGEYARMIATPGMDIHSHYSSITGLTRAETKTTTYAFLYGAGNLKIGIGVGVLEEHIAQLASSAAAKSYIRWMTKLLGDKFVMPDQRTLALVTRGGQVKDAFMEGITGLKDLKKAITEYGQQYGFIIGIDGRKLSTRKAHAALNTQLQGDGAIVCKEWMMETDRILQYEEKLVPDKDYGQMAWVHDELQFEHQEGLDEIIAAASKEAMRRVAVSLDFRGELTTESKHGYNWRDCH